MSADDVAAFEGSLADLDVGLTRTGPDGFGDAVAAAIEEPAVGAALPFESVSLEDTAVTLEPTPRDLRAATTSVTPARLGIASYGSLAIESRPAGDEPISLYPRRHVAVLRAGDVVPDVASALDVLGEDVIGEGGSAVLATGASATGDMGAIVEGVHGPLEVHVVLIEP
ncbi:MAG: LUD domain-containing protein [Halobacteriales archaeon]